MKVWELAEKLKNTEYQDLDVVFFDECCYIDVELLSLTDIRARPTRGVVERTVLELS